MKYIKLYENFKDIDIFNEEDWNETENDNSFLWWLKQNYPNQNDWKYINYINCHHNNLINLNGIENLTNLEHLNCSYNKLYNLKGIEKLTNLEQLFCHHNNNLINLNGIENCINLKDLWCHNNNKLENLNGIKNLTFLKNIFCDNNQFNNKYKEYLKNYCNEKNIYLYI